MRWCLASAPCSPPGHTHTHSHPDRRAEAGRQMKPPFCGAGTEQTSKCKIDSRADLISASWQVAGPAGTERAPCTPGLSSWPLEVKGQRPLAGTSPCPTSLMALSAHRGLPLPLPHLPPPLTPFQSTSLFPTLLPFLWPPPGTYWEGARSRAGGGLSSSPRAGLSTGHLHTPLREHAFPTSPCDPPTV